MQTPLQSPDSTHLPMQINKVEWGNQADEGERRAGAEREREEGGPFFGVRKNKSSLFKQLNGVNNCSYT